MSPTPPPAKPESAPGSELPSSAADDELALARYRYLLKTAPPELIEQAHSQAIARLTPAQRQGLLQQVGAMLPPSERALAGPANDTPHGIARLLTRAELQQPGLAERLFSALPLAGANGGLALGGVFGAALLGSVVGVVAGSAIGSAAFGDGSPALDDAGELDLGGLFDF